MYAIQDWNRDISLIDEEEYQAFIRALLLADGFDLLFVRCLSSKELINKAKKELPRKRIEVLSLDKPIDNLYQIVQNLPNKDEIDILFITGIEKSLEDYIKPGFGGVGGYYNRDTIPSILGHLNLKRESFRDKFNICFVFFVPLYALKYFIRRAPDFFDWNSGVFEFDAEDEFLQRESSRLLAEIKENLAYKDLTPEDRHKKLLEIQSLIDEDNQIDKHKIDLLIEQGDIFQIDDKYRDAIASYDRALKINPSLENAWAKKGFCLLKLDFFEEAIDSFDRALEINPQSKIISKIILPSKSLITIRLGRSEEALKFLNNLLKITPNIENYWSIRGFLLSGLGKLEEALNSYNKFIKLNPSSFDAWLSKGVVLGKLERYEEALQSLNQALKIDSNHWEVWYYQGLALFKLERYQQAIESFDEALKIDSNHWEVWQNKGGTLLNLERYEEALQSFDRALEIDSNHWEVWQYKGIVLANLQRHEEALKSFDRALKIDSNHWEVWQNKGLVLGNLKRYEEAIQSFDRALEIDSNQWEIWQQKGRILYLLGDCNQSLNSFKKSLELNQENGETWNNIGYLLLCEECYQDQAVFEKPLKIQLNLSQVDSDDLTRYKEALNYFNKALKLEPNTPLILANKSYPLYYLARYEEAYKSCHQAIKLKFKNEVVWANQGFILMKLGRYKQAISSFKEALKLDKTYQDAWYNLAIIYALRGNKKEARNYLKQAKQAIKFNYDKYLLAKNYAKQNFPNKSPVAIELDALGLSHPGS